MCVVFSSVRFILYSGTRSRNSVGRLLRRECVQESLSLNKVIREFAWKLHIKLNIEIATCFALLLIILASNAFSLNFGYISGGHNLVNRNGEVSSVERHQADRFALDCVTQRHSVFVDEIEISEARKETSI